LKSWLWNQFQIKLYHTSIYHPCSNLSEKAHSSYNKALDFYYKDSDSYGSDNWSDTLCKLVLSLNSEINPTTGYSPIEIYKNRLLQNIGPTKFFQCGLEAKSSFLRFSNKVQSAMKSRLKTNLSVFKYDQEVKVCFKGKQPRFGICKDTKDDETRTSVLIKLNDSNRPLMINKNFICIT